MLTRLSALVSFGNPEDPRTHVKSLIVADVQMMSSLSAIQSLAELQAKFRPDALMSFNDIMLACEEITKLERQEEAWCDRLAFFGLELHVKKTEDLTMDVNEQDLLGSVVLSSHGLHLSSVLDQRSCPMAA
ncbi:unnamed protein product [Heligmosomoides polygyrus]|uniref:Reverse transcriptase domain-containing protein n=1 Tax=Heligmosomoides polygyrus TaxID=6339 RepID=A0A3P8BHB4_HELPZ|nr:unnamed protein product [Heligmosomoides polygyrus]